MHIEVPEHVSPGDDFTIQITEAEHSFAYIMNVHIPADPGTSSWHLSPRPIRTDEAGAATANVSVPAIFKEGLQRVFVIEISEPGKSGKVVERREIPIRL